MRRILIVLALLAGAAACGDDDGGHTVTPDAPPGPTPDAPGTTPDAAGGCGGEFSAFVIDLVDNQTRDDNEPTAIDDCSFTDAEDPAAFDSLF